MKTLRSAICALVALSLCGSSMFAADAVTALFKEAEAAYLRGDLAVAKPKFESLYSLDPKNAAVIKYLKLIAAKEAQGLGSGSQEKQLASLMIPKVEFKDATLSAALEFLKQSVTKTSGGKLAVNFVVQVPEAQANTPVTLSLTNIPFTEVLKYIGGLANVSFVYDRYAIMVRPAVAATVEANAAPTQ